MNVRLRRSPWLRAALWFWLILSAGGAILVAVPATVSAAELSRVTPRCERMEREGRPCSACGLTRAFYAMSRGDTDAAREFNPLGPALYIASALNSVAAFCAAIWIRGRS